MADGYLGNVWVCSGTNINRKHVKYFSGKGAAKAFFTGKVHAGPWRVSQIRESSMWARNTSSVHLPGEISDYANCDFICYQNDNEGVFWVCKITGLESVNQNTSRIYFEPDYWHTWIEQVEFGFCLVERRHFEDMSDPYLSLLPEPINVPSYIVNGPMQDIDSKIGALMDNSQYIVYLSTDEYNNANSSDVQVHNLMGAPYWGKIATFPTPQATANYLKSYINNNGITQTSVLPVLSNVQRVIYAPVALVQESNSGYSQEGEQVLPLKLGKFGKVLSPQFLRGKIVQNGNGSSIDIDITRFNIDDDTGRISIGYKIEGCGGLFPKMRVSFAVFINWDEYSNDSETSVIDFADFPEIPIHASIAPRPTTYGALSAVFSGASSGLTTGTAVGAMGGPEAAPFGAAIGVGLGAEIGLQNALNPAMTDYLKVGGTPEMVVSQKLYSHIALLEKPTPEGQRILEDFFNTYGYYVMLREKLTLKHGTNFTYVKLAEPATQQSKTVPHIAFNAISDILQGGVTIWVADIGSTKEYS